MRFALPGFALIFALVASLGTHSAAAAATATASMGHKSAQSSNVLGFGAGAFIPQGIETDRYGTSWQTTIRGLAFGRGIAGGRSAISYANASGKNGAASGDTYGIDLDLALRFGHKTTGFYAFVGPGYYWTHFDRANPVTPGGPDVRFSDSNISANAGFGYSYKAFFVEASYVNVFTPGDDVKFIPVTVGFQF
ncbi:MAG TPA: hypothetical protein VMR65_05555 [Candidatus Sulfotelmatobacter sp.]|jgi:hypothetical protein|nr:hypothetical protein [Candidatus Sulfotelmatobacter sp.]